MAVPPPVPRDDQRLAPSPPQDGPRLRPHTDFLLEIELEDLAQLEQAFSVLSLATAEDERRYGLLHQMTGRVEIGLYRPYPDPSQRERVALV